MYDPENLDRSHKENRPSWELSTRDRFGEWFSSHKVEGENQQARHQAEQRRKEAARRQQAQRARALEQARAERQAQMDAQRENVWQQTTQTQEAQSAPNQDPRGQRYHYAQPLTPNAPQGGKNAIGVAVIVVLAMVATFGFQYFLNDSDSQETGEWYAEVEPAPEPDEDQGEGGFPWDSAIPETEGAEESSAELDRAELDRELNLDIQSAQELTPLSYQELYAKCLPSTVSITVVGQTGVGTGTGIVMTEDGYILTCNHVIEDGITCQVTTSDDETYDALLVGGDAQTDLAVLKIEAEGLTPAQFGDSDELTVGDEALAIGDPLGTELRGTLTNGIISAINRNVTVNSYSMTLIQTTAALNSGNSGGPLLNIYGQVVGVNNMKMNSSQVTVEGLGFAVPTSVVREIVPVLSTQGKVSRPVLGITCYGIDQETMERNGEPVTGLCVATVDEGSDAYAQGLLVGDYITAVNGTPVVSVEEVKEIIEDLSIGDTVEVDVFRLDQETGESEEFSLTIALVDQSELS